MKDFTPATTAKSPGSWSMLGRALAGLVLLCGAGCIVPIRSQVTSGYRPSAEARAFLKLPGTTRDEVLASFGPPLLEVPSARVLLYDWMAAPRYLVSVPHVVHRTIEIRPETDVGDPDRFGLFIAYDESGLVTAHQIRRLGVRSIEVACAQWAEARARRR